MVCEIYMLPTCTKVYICEKLCHNINTVYNSKRCARSIYVLPVSVFIAITVYTCVSSGIFSQ